VGRTCGGGTLGLRQRLHVPDHRLGVVLVLDTLAVILGLIGVRQPTVKALSGAAIGIGATGIVGVFIYVIGTLVIMPRVV